MFVIPSKSPVITGSHGHAESEHREALAVAQDATDFFIPSFM